MLYITYPSYKDCAEVLDDRRLNRARSEVQTVLRSLVKPANGEAVAQDARVIPWAGNEGSLIKFGIMLCLEWKARGNSDSLIPKLLQWSNRDGWGDDTPPEWLEDPLIHASHRAYLLRSLPSHYRRYWPDMDDKLPLVYPRQPERGSALTYQEKQNAAAIRKARRIKTKIATLKEELDQLVKDYDLDENTLVPNPGKGKKLKSQLELPFEPPTLEPPTQSSPLDEFNFPGLR